MKTLALMIAIVALGAVEARTVHRSFRNGYPVRGGVGVRSESNPAVLKAPTVARRKSVVVTNRVVLTREQAEKLLKARQRKSKPGSSQRSSTGDAGKSR